MGIDLGVVEKHEEALLLDIDRQPDVFVHGLGGCWKLLGEDVEEAITADKPHEMVAAMLGFRKRVSRSLGCARKPQRGPTRRQGRPRRFASKLAVAVAAIVAPLRELVRRCERREVGHVVVVKLDRLTRRTRDLWRWSMTYS